MPRLPRVQYRVHDRHTVHVEGYGFRADRVEGTPGTPAMAYQVSLPWQEMVQFPLLKEPETVAPL